MNKIKKGNKGFVIFLCVYSLILVIGICAGLYYVWNLLIDYEASIPDVNMDRFVTEFEGDNIGNLLDEYSFEYSEFEKWDDVKKTYADKISDKQISYRKLSKEYTNSVPVYEIMAEDEAFARVSLVADGTNDHGFNLWKMNDITFYTDNTFTHSATIKVPHEATVSVNGIVLGKEYVTESKKVELTDNISEYVDVIPSFDVYMVEGLVNEPAIQIDGNNLIKTKEDYDYSYSYGTDEELLPKVSKKISDMSHEYGAYLVNKGNLTALRSYTIGKAKTYVSSVPGVNFYLTDEDYTYTFLDEKIENFTKYNDKCFSCDISYTLSVTYRTTRNITYDTSLSCMYVLVNGEWYLADFAIN